VTLLGPDPAVVHAVNDKTWQYRNLSAVVPMVDFEVCDGRAAMLEACGRLGCACGRRVFVSCPYSAAGASSMVVADAAQAGARFDQDGCFLVSRYVPPQWAPTVLGVVGNEREVFVAGVADMTIEDGNKFRGSTFPSQLPEAVQAALRGHTAAVGRALGRMGFRGIFGCDYIVAPDGAVYFIEVNPRKQGTTMEFCCNPGAPAARRRARTCRSWRSPPCWTGISPRARPGPEFGRTAGLGLHWGTYNHKIETSACAPRAPSCRTCPSATCSAALRRTGRAGPWCWSMWAAGGRPARHVPGPGGRRGPTREQMLAALAGGRNQLAASITGA
jgi:hypothetical protein